MADRSVKVRFEADVNGFVSGVRRAGAATEDFAKKGLASATKHKQEWEQLGRGALVAGAAIAAGVGLAIKTYADFSKSMSGVQAVSGATAGQMRLLSDAALKAGADTVFSASDAAKAEAELAKAGVSVSDILGGALLGSMNLAAAGQIDLADAATISAQAMNIFSLKGKDVGHIADVLTAGANKSAAGVQDLGLALRQGGLVAGQTGLTFEETVATLSAFADSALIGSDAGTSLKTMLQRLTPQSKQAAEEMGRLGFSAYDAKGNFVGLPELAGRLQASFGDLSPKARNAALAIVFGSDAVRGANVLMKQGEQGIRSYIKAVDDNGAAARMASIQMDNLSGDVEQLKGSLETALIKTGSGANGVLRDMVQAATGVVNKFSELPDAAQTAVLAVGGVTSATLLGVGAFLTIIPKIAETKKAMEALGITSKLTRANMVAFATGPYGLAIAGLAVAVGLFAKSQLDAKQKADDLRNSLNQQTGAITENTKALVAKNLQEDGSLDRARMLGLSLQTVTDAALGQTDALHKVAAGQKALNAEYDALRQKAKTGELTQAEYDRLVVLQQQSGIYQQLTKDIHANSEVLNPQIKKQKQIAEATGGAKDSTEAYVKAQQRLYQQQQQSQQVMDEFGNELVDEKGKAVDLKTALDNLANSVEGLLNPTLDESNANIQLKQSIRDAEKAARAYIKTHGQSTHAFDLNTKAGLANQKALNDVISAEETHIGAMIRNKRSTSDVTAAMRATNDRIWKMVYAFTGSKKAANEMSRQFGYTDKDIQRVRDSMKEARSRADDLTSGLQRVGRQHPNPKVSVQTAQAMKNVDEFQHAISHLHGRNVTVNARFNAASIRSNNATRQQLYAQAQGRATGGPVVGDGGPTSDSVPAVTDSGDLYALSNGEHVWTARETQAVGGHAEMARLRKAALAGRVQYRAFGGPITPGHMSSDLNSYLDSYIAQVGPAFWRKMFASFAGGPHFGGSYRQIEAMIAAAVPGQMVTSDYRPGARTTFGNLSRHAMGKAVDYAPTRALWDWLFPRRGEFYELLGPWGMFLRGRPYYDPTVAAMHKNHIHVSAYAQGTSSARKGWALVGENEPELVKFNGGEQVKPGRYASQRITEQPRAVAATAAASGPSYSATVYATSDKAADIVSAWSWEVRRQSLPGVYQRG